MRILAGFALTSIPVSHADSRLSQPMRAAGDRTALCSSRDSLMIRQFSSSPSRPDSGLFCLILMPYDVVSKATDSIDRVTGEQPVHAQPLPVLLNAAKITDTRHGAPPSRLVSSCAIIPHNPSSDNASHDGLHRLSRPRPHTLHGYRRQSVHTCRHSHVTHRSSPFLREPVIKMGGCLYRVGRVCMSAKK